VLHAVERGKRGSEVGNEVKNKSAGGIKTMGERKRISGKRKKYLQLRGGKKIGATTSEGTKKHWKGG